MEIITMRLDDLKPYSNNTKKHPQEQIDEIKESIARYGMNDPIAIWGKSNVIVEGHGRLEALRQMGIKEAPCIRLDHLTDKQRREYTIAHNKTTMDSGFDKDMLSLELPGLDLGFLGYVDEPEEEEDDGYYGDSRERTYNQINLRDFNADRTEGIYEMPKINAVQHIPQDLIAFDYCINKDAFDCGVHFYRDDYMIERIWRDPHKYKNRLSKFDCVLTPDFSLYLDMPLAMQIWNVYRSRLIGQIMQDAGITVIPTLQWADERSFDFCFDGIEPGGVVSVSTIGVKRDKNAGGIWFAGMDEAIKRLRPSHIVCYGGDIGYKFPCGVSYIANHNTERFRGKS